MDEQEYGVFFEAENLSNVELKHVKKYFGIKRKSGGGECDINKVGENIYKITFMEKGALERVLGRKDHVINIPGQANITVSLSSENVAESSKQPQASANLECASAKDMEKVFKLDHYLLRFLSECAKANAELKKLLSALFSTFKIHIDLEELVVVRDQAAAEDDLPLKKWEFEVDKVCDALKSRYVIHFEVDGDRLKILKEYSFLSGKTLNIFHEEDKCLAVIVGELKEMEKILKFVSDLQEQQQVQKECCIPEKRYSLIKEQFESHIKSNLPGLKIPQEKADMVLIKGPEKEINAGEKELLKLAQGIQEKRIPLHQALLSFLDSSDGIRHFQNRFRQSLRSPVMLETLGSDLLLMSLSDGALEEAAAAVKRDLCLDTVHLENTQKLTAFNKLKQDLIEAMGHANRDRVKVELKYQDESSSDAKVQLVGYATEVSRLKDIVQDYIRNHENHKDYLSLCMPEMVDHFSEILSMADLKVTSVDMKPTCSPSPCVHLTGPRCEVKSLKDSLESFLKRLTTKRFEMKGPGVQQFFQSNGAETLRLVKNSYRVGIMPIDERGRDKVPIYRSHLSFQSLPSTASTQDPPDPDCEIDIQVVIGSLEEQQADVLVAPMIKANMTSTLIGSSLSRKAGLQLESNFDNAKTHCTLKPGNVLEVDATSTLKCSKVFFVECVPKGRIINNSEKALRSGLGRVFELCAQNSWGSIALPIIGPGIALSIPVKDAVNILTQEICKFLKGPTGHLHTIIIAIMPNYSNSEEIFQTVCGNLSAKMVDNKGQALFHSLMSDLDDIMMPVDRTELHLVFGDITNETTDAIVNTTDFRDFQTSGVCKDILTKAGPPVLAQLTGAQVGSGQIFTTPPGDFPCRTIMHVCGERKPDVIKTLAKEIVVQSEHGRYRSVAIPAICAGQGGLDPNVVAKSILEGVKDGVQGASLQYLKNIRIILFKINVFLAFKTMAQQMFGGRTQLTAPAPLAPAGVTRRGRSGSTVPRRSRSQSVPRLIDFSSLVPSLPDTQKTATFLVVGHSNGQVSDACSELQRAYDNQCSTHTFFSDEIGCLTKEEMDKLLVTANELHLQFEGSNSDEWAVKGLKEGVKEVVRLTQDALRRWKRNKEQVELFAKVSWCILGERGIWHKLPKAVNQKLEKNDVKDGIEDTQGVRWTVDLSRMKATACVSGKVTALKRLENLPDFSFPIYWDSMNQNEPFKMISLDPQTAEYQTVKADFKKTVPKTVLKIERIQNINLRRLYEGHKIELENRNGFHVGAGEKILYHGTSEVSCSTIMNTKFDRRFAGQNATVYGHGTYFAVNASYSANPTYAVPAADGTQLMFVVRVLTGYYEKGLQGMKAPPVRLPPHILYDSVVDNVQNPSMFVVFHDCQAYPDYLITFK